MFCNGVETPKEQPQMTEEEFNESLKGKQSLSELKTQIEASQKEQERLARESALREIAEAEERMGFK